MTNVVYNWDEPLYLSKYYEPGLGYSTSSGPPVGGYGPANPRIYSSTFFGSDVKDLLPLNSGFGRKRLRKSRLWKNLDDRFDDFMSEGSNSKALRGISKRSKTKLLKKL